MTATCHVARILRSSAVDGPGNRSVVFLQGCDFDCLYCHNPETRKPCNACGLCVPACRYDALRICNGEILWNPQICRDCGACIAVCPHSSSPKTRRMTVEQILSDILPWRAFLRGITISGGECLLQPDCTTAILETAARADLPGLVDTNGSTPLADLPGLVAAAEGFMLDIKAWDDDEHRSLTRAGNATVLANLDFLIPTDKLLEVRTVITGTFDAEQTVREVARRIARAPNPVRYRIIAFRPEGVQAAGRAACQTPDATLLERLRGIALTEGARDVLLIRMP